MKLLNQAVAMALLFAFGQVGISGCSKEAINSKEEPPIIYSKVSLSKLKKADCVHQPICQAAVKELYAIDITLKSYKEYYARNLDIHSILGHSCRTLVKRNGFIKKTWHGKFTASTLTNPEIIGESYDKSSSNEAVFEAMLNYWKKIAKLDNVTCAKLKQVEGAFDQPFINSPKK